MKNIFFIAAVLWTYCLSAATKQPEQIIPVPFNEVTLTGGFWGERMQTELDVTLPFSLVQAGPAIEQLQGGADFLEGRGGQSISCLLYTSPSPRDRTRSRMPSSA